MVKILGETLIKLQKNWFYGQFVLFNYFVVVIWGVNKIWCWIIF